ncbi:macrophage mannose receptor 1-like [Denticeps clupeoides]|uniref:macrophage mannose receptor 1-like n=1 Tax=Denticeps clupeoides TaxID=299321 RepID=UPI0010A4FBCB|nr:macrophage mannose receptor 1-like [Denticeps clupeoides]
MLLLLLLSGLCFFSACAAKEFHFLSEAMTWTESQLYCRANFTDLATIENTAETNNINSIVIGTYSGLAWIGLYDVWTWSLKGSSFYGSGETEYRNWYPGYPTNYYDCTIMYVQWINQYCNYQYPFVCYNANNNQYIYVGEVKSWTDAQTYCRSTYTDLVSIRSSAENAKVSALRQNSFMWIGLYRTRTWSDQSNSTFTNWKSGQPDNAGCTAASFTNSGQWAEENCGSSLPFICYDSLMYVGLQVKFTSSTDLTWSEIEQTVVNQLYEEFVKHGLPGNIKLQLKNVQRTQN